MIDTLYKYIFQIYTLFGIEDRSEVRLATDLKRRSKESSASGDNRSKSKYHIDNGSKVYVELGQFIFFFFKLNLDWSIFNVILDGSNFKDSTISNRSSIK